MTRRPNGKRLMLSGKLAFFAGVLAAVLGAFRPLWPGVLSYHPVAEILSLVGILGTLLGAVSWMVGYLVFAISYLPGKSD